MSKASNFGKTFDLRDSCEHQLVYAEDYFWDSSAGIGWLGKDSLKTKVS
jgi:hypothetical protein